MAVIHIVPAGRGPWVLERVLERTKQPGEVLAFPDDLAFGPITDDLVETRASIKTDYYDIATKSERLAAFWTRLERDGPPIILWLGRHSAEEMAMLLMMCGRLPTRDLSIVDVTNLSIRASWNGASPAIPPPRGMHEVPASVLSLLLGKHVQLERTQRDAYAARWRFLQAENAPYRVIGGDGLRSAAGEYFDTFLIEALSDDWRRTAWVVRRAERLAGRHYRQVGFFGLLKRAADLVDQGVIEAQGDIWDPWSEDGSALRLQIARPTATEEREIYHVASHPSFAGGLAGCLAQAGLDEDVLGFPDELSAGPIASDEAEIRAQWWNHITAWPDHDSISAFWRDVAERPKLVVWFGRNDERDQCLYLALCDRFPDRIAALGDVSSISVRYDWTDGTALEFPQADNVHGVPENVLSSLVAYTAQPDPVGIAINARRWRELKTENALFRMVVDSRLVSQPATYFDDAILSGASGDWQQTIRIVAHALNENRVKSHHVSEYALLSRIVALVEADALEAEGDVRSWSMRNSRLRLPHSD